MKRACILLFALALAAAPALADMGRMMEHGGEGTREGYAESWKPGPFECGMMGTMMQPGSGMGPMGGFMMGQWLMRPDAAASERFLIRPRRT